MQDLIQIKTTPPSIVANFDEIEAQLREHLQQFDVVVTPEHVGDAKKLRTELRKQISELDARIKDALKDASEPIREADERRKALVQLGRDVDAKIKEQVDRCEAETKKKVEQLLNEQREQLWLKYGVDDEFKSAEFDDLVKLTSITKKGRLSKSATDALDSRVRDDKALQDRTEHRLAALSGISYEMGLAAPLTRDHVQHFLFVGDDRYNAELQRILDAEVDRQAKAEQRAREQAERDQRAKAEAEQREADRQRRIEDAAAAERATPQEAAAEPRTEEVPPWKPEPAPAPVQADSDGKVSYLVVATFEIRVHPNTTIDQIRAGAEQVLQSAGIKTLRNVTAQKKQAAA